MFLNVLQGFDIPTGDVWYDAVKHFPFEGWAFGGNNMCDMTMAPRLISIARFLNYLTIEIGYIS